VEEQVRRGDGQRAGRIRELEVENAKLKRMYADLALENVALKDVVSRKW
jgi:putative transposase